MLDEDELNKRSFITKVETLKDYMSFLDKLEEVVKQKKDLFAKLLNKDMDVNSKIDNYLSKDKIINLGKLDKCSLSVSVEIA